MKQAELSYYNREMLRAQNDIPTCQGELWKTEQSYNQAAGEYNAYQEFLHEIDKSEPDKGYLPVLRGLAF